MDVEPIRMNTDGQRRGRTPGASASPSRCGEPCQFHLNLLALPSRNPMDTNDAGRSLYWRSPANSPRGVHGWRAAGA